jgi:class 3 adenylate cyclase
VNLAQRLQQWARPGETVVGKASAEVLRSLVELESLEPALVKGRDTLVHAYRVVGPVEP